MKNITNTSNGSTMKWKEKLIKLVENEINNDQNAKLFYDNERIDNRRVGVHLAILLNHFYRYF